MKFAFHRNKHILKDDYIQRMKTQVTKRKYLQKTSDKELLSKYTKNS